MSDISKSSKTYSRRRINEIDDTIEYLTHAAEKMNDFVLKSEFECSLMTAKLKREKVKALAAAAKSQAILTEMDILIAETDLYSDLERLKNCKRIKLDQNGGSQSVSRNTSPNISASSNKSKSRKSSKQDSFDAKKKSVSLNEINFATEDTVLIETIDQNKSTSVIESSQSTNLGGLNSSPDARKSDSEVLMSSSINAEFNSPYEKTLNTINKPQTRSNKTDLGNSKSKSSNKKKQTQLKSRLTAKTVTDSNKSVFSTGLNPSQDFNNSKKVFTPKNISLETDTEYTVHASSYGIRHNLPIMISHVKGAYQPSSSTSAKSPCQLNTAMTNANSYQTPTKDMNYSQKFHFYSSKQ